MIAAVVVEIEEITAAEAEETGDNLKMRQFENLKMLTGSNFQAARGDQLPSFSNFQIFKFSNCNKNVTA
jgi:hypothetical protein